MPSGLQLRWKLPGIAAVVALGLAGQSDAQAQGHPAAASDAQIVRAVGTVRNIQADSITLVADSGSEVTAKLSAATKILRVPPGEKDLKNALPLPAQDLQTGDRVLVRGLGSADGRSVAALAVIVMKQGDVSAKRQRDRDDWQKRGVGGLVTAVDAGSGTVTISSGGLGAKRSVAVHTSKDTVVRRYAANSVKFDDARPAPLDQIKPGDQLRARGTRSADGAELQAEEIVSGTFRNIAGIIAAVDPAGGTITVQDAILKTKVVVKISTDSQLKKLPAAMAQRIAMRLKGGQSEGANGGPAAQGSASSAAGVAPAAGSHMSRGPGAIAGERENGPPDLQRLLSRLPDSTLADVQKGDAVMIVSTTSEDSATVTAITLLAGVEPILAAAPSQGASMLLSPWNLGTSNGEADAAP
jgi:Domain of unknown function (DUF5666)